MSDLNFNFPENFNAKAAFAEMGIEISPKLETAFEHIANCSECKSMAQNPQVVITGLMSGGKLPCSEGGKLMKDAHKDFHKAVAPLIQGIVEKRSNELSAARRAETLTMMEEIEKEEILSDRER